MDINDLLRGTLERNSDGAKPMGKTAQKERARLLRAVRTKFLERHTFAPGDLIVQKDACRNYRYPGSGEPAIVVEVFEAAKTKGGKPDTNHEMDIEDIAIGVMVDNDFQLFSVDSRRFEPWEE